jgi:hypothetical protein
MNSIVQIEMTNYCNRCCVYCGQTNMTRQKGFITMETIQRCIEILLLIKQKTVGLNHYGESFLHPEIIEIIEMLNASDIKPWIYTNGDLIYKHDKERISKLKLHVLVISGHALYDERYNAAQYCESLGLPVSIQQSMTPKRAIDIAGQVKGYATNCTKNILKDPENHCRFLKEQNYVVLWNGDLVPCCMDYDGKDIFGSIYDINVLSLVAKAGKLCNQCGGHPGNIL